MPRWAQTAFLLIPGVVLGQVSANSVTVTATESAALQPDEAYFDVSVASGSDKALNDIVTALQGSGITAANFVRLTSLLPAARTATPPQPSFQWTFQTLVPLAKLKDTTAAFAALAQGLPQNNSGLSLTFAVQGTAVSAQQTTNCKLSDLVSSARTQAQQLTNAAGLTPGMILSLTTATSPSAPTACSLTVRFLLGTQLMQSEPGSITITATRPLSVQPDQIVISLSVTSSPSSGLDDVTAALQQAGLSGVTFTGLYTSTIYLAQGAAPPKPQSQLQWNFTLAAPLAKFADTISQISSAEQALTKAGSALTLSLSAATPQVSAQLAQSQTCPDADLLKDAQAQAQNVAAAAGVKAGAILNLGNSSTAGLIFDPVASPIYQSQWFAPSNCSLTVAFQLSQQ
ncbi:MAG TPA: SIMPL domain-containing protein [Bryobacteraceae bacterium]|nr:SIMPL domain-containing protein [Bryobacteraceae bacterium]